MRNEGLPPTQHVREALVCGQIAQMVALPVLVAVVLLWHHELRWAYLAGAAVCVFASVISFAFFLAFTRGKAGLHAQVLIAFVLSCLAIIAIGLIELGTSDPFGTFMPGVLVPVVFMSIVGDMAVLVGVNSVAIATVVLVGWVSGARGNQLAANTVIYATTAVLITWLASRTVASLAKRVTFRRSVSKLNDALTAVGSAATQNGTDLIGEIFMRGLPLVSSVMPAEHITVFVRQSRTGRFLSVATWPDGAPDVCGDPETVPELAECLLTHSVVLGDDLCVVPIGYCTDGELIMVVRRTPHEHVDHRASESAEALASAFLRVTSRVNFVKGLQTESRTDPLTGLANRRTLYERLQVEMEHALRYETPLSIAMIDLDHFKDYNDRHGHVAGDTVLRSIAALLVSNTRGQDLVVRYGGEEFCLVMPDTDIIGGHHLLDQLRTGGRDTTSSFAVTLSAGLTSWDGIEDSTSMIERADQALYRAKQTGRDRVVSIESVTGY